MPVTVGNLGGMLKRKYITSHAADKLPKDKGKDLWVKTILNQNKDKNFVKRIQDPDNSPVTNNNDGSISTHRMASGDGMVFPTMVQLPGQKNLARLEPKMANRYAQKTGENIKFNSDEQAQEFAKNYKRGLGKK